MTSSIPLIISVCRCDPSAQPRFLRRWDRKEQREDFLWHRSTIDAFICLPTHRATILAWQTSRCSFRGLAFRNKDGRTDLEGSKTLRQSILPVRAVAERIDPTEESTDGCTLSVHTTLQDIFKKEKKNLEPCPPSFVSM
jgi:hypothetical protein